MEETGKKRFGSWTTEDNRPLWIVYFDRILWIVLIAMVFIYGYNYFFGFTKVTIVDINNRVCGGGTIKSSILNYSDLVRQGFKVYENNKEYVDKINNIKLTP